MSTITLVEHLARVEGHGGITVEMEGDAVTDVRFDVMEGPRLLELLLKGQPYQQVAPILQRICSICSVAHTVTSLAATEAAFGVVPSPQTQLLRELLFRGENIESHALHVFLLALPDYFGVPSAPALAKTQPEPVRAGLRLKQLGNLIQEVIGGRAVHPVNAVLGGFGHLPSHADLASLRDRLRAAMDDARLAVEVASSLPADDFVESETTYAAIEMHGDYGYYNTGDQVVVVSPMGRRHFPARDYRSITNERAVAHAYAKHSTLDGESFMVGALARLTANRRRVTPTGTDAIARLGIVLPSANPMDNTRAQVVELVMDIERSLGIVEQLLDKGMKPEAPVDVVPRAGSGTVVTEAPRGILVHSYEYDAQGRIASADVITPTAINAASMEHHFRETVEQSTDKSVPELTRRLEMVARAYDPCISCSVHLVQRAWSPGYERHVPSRIIVGLGNPLAGDDGIGWRLAELLTNDLRLPPSIEVMCGGDDVLRLAPHLAGRKEVLFIDASLGAEVGSVEVMEQPKARELPPGRAHAHHVGPIEAVDLLLGSTEGMADARVRWAFVGIDGVRQGGGLSPLLEARVPRAIDEILKAALANWAIPASR